MKKVLLQIKKIKMVALAMVAMLLFPVMADVSNPHIYNVTLTEANKEYSQALPDNAVMITVQCRTAYAVRLAFETGKVATPTAPYATIKSGNVYYDTGLKSKNTIYLASAQAGVVVEIIVWGLD